ncbi:glycoside hydrolase family 9 protein [candidate division KSB1 bacterium]|nr:glycoside hydrolase family 9 protein [candidate division KSB1 bacterium]
MIIKIIKKIFHKYYLIVFALLYFACKAIATPQTLVLSDQDYFEMPGLNVMLFHDFYPEGHQSGVTIIQNGVRVASNGDVRLEPAPGQWQPIPKVGKRIVDKSNLVLSVPCSYPDSSKNRTGFNPIKYPNFELSYTIHVKAEGQSIRIIVNLDRELSEHWVGKVGFNLELFPGELFGKSFIMDETIGLFPRQLNGPMVNDKINGLQNQPFAVGKHLVIAPESDQQRMSIHSLKNELELIDGRALHNNGWYIVRTPLLANTTDAAAEWIITPHAIPGWTYSPVIHISQIGYHPNQSKLAVIECDLQHQQAEVATLCQILPSGELRPVKTAAPTHWGQFLRYQYFQYDFSEVRKNGLYMITYGDSKSNPFKITTDIFDRHVWQPTLEYFLPVQMCHMRVNDRYRVWHGLCHMDDALMAPTDSIHFDGYRQGESTLCAFQPMDHVPGLNVGGWHDAGDYDLRVESQAGTVRILSLTYELFHVDYDETTIDQQRHLVELHQPDGQPDILQQIEHGVLSILGGYNNLGRLYRGIICSDLRQYVMLGDGSTMTNNTPYDKTLPTDQIGSDTPDDRWVFTEQNPRRELMVAGCLAAASRALKNYKPALSDECLQVAMALWQTNQHVEGQAIAKTEALVELIIATDNSEYKHELSAMLPDIQQHLQRTGWMVGRVLPQLDNEEFTQIVTDSVRASYHRLTDVVKANPFRAPYQPHIWGAGWMIQQIGIHYYFLHTAWPEIVPKDHMLDALNFILGCHPGSNTASFVSGVGSESVTVAYGVNRADWSYIPGGVVSGTALVRPDFPELKVWPYFWQQTEYVLGGGASNFMFLTLAAQHLLAN